jgi:hypothetical protein
VNLIDEITAADDELRQAEANATEASARLRNARSQVRACREELSRLIRELKTGESRYPLLERISLGGVLPPTHDEHQRGPTAFQEPTSPHLGTPGTRAAMPRRKEKPTAG